jgi:hypothetical protein
MGHSNQRRGVLWDRMGQKESVYEIIRQANTVYAAANRDFGLYPESERSRQWIESRHTPGLSSKLRCLTKNTEELWAAWDGHS